MLTEETEATIHRLFFVEKWKKSAIARELNVHYSVVRRIVQSCGVSPARRKRSSRIDPYMTFVLETIERYPRITAARLFGMVSERGYQGKQDHFRHLIAKLRPRRSPEPFLRIKTLAGEESQVDWAHFGYIEIGRSRRQLMAFVMVLSYSRRIFLRFYPGQSAYWFLLGHVEALIEFGGCPRRMLYDNLKSAVLNRRGDAIEFNPELLKLAMFYRFEPRPCGVRKGNEKGRVERAIRYIRTAFFEALSWHSLEDLNQKAKEFCNGLAMQRRWPEDNTLTVKQAFEIEASALLQLPATPYPVFDCAATSARKTPYVRFDLNDYSIPHERIGRSLSILASPEQVRIFDGTQVIAEHIRSFDKGRVVEIEAHVAAVKALKTQARRGSTIDRLAQILPESVLFLQNALEAKANLGAHAQTLKKMLEVYTIEEMRFGLGEALLRNCFHPHAVRHSIERRREERCIQPPLPIILPDDPRVLELDVIPHDLCNYDEEIGS